MNIPIIDISSLVKDNSNSEEFNKTVYEIKSACENIGFFLVKNHGISKNIITQLSNQTRIFFDSNFEYKNKFFEKNQEDYPFGYMGIGYETLKAGYDPSINKTRIYPDLKESFSIGSNEKTIWPNNIKESWENYLIVMNNLVHKILQAFALALNKDINFFNKYITNHASALRALNYPEINYQIVNQQIRASKHTDYGIMTVLKTDGPGLQVYSKNKEWIDVPIIEDTFIINIGDMMQRWTNDKWMSTLHRVINTDNNKRRRQSFAYFFNPNSDSIIESIIDNENPKYEPIKSKDFLMKKHIDAIN